MYHGDIMNNYVGTFSCMFSTSGQNAITIQLHKLKQYLASRNVIKME